MKSVNFSITLLLGFLLVSCSGYSRGPNSASRQADFMVSCQSRGLTEANCQQQFEERSAKIEQCINSGSTPRDCASRLYQK
ncbi:MAG: hypothetical protein ACO2ZM_04825 [Francisellaceae bacterium]